MADVLLTVSGVIPADVEAQVAAGKRPRPDYLELARVLQADLLDYGQVRAEGKLVRQLERWGGPDLALAWVCFQRRHRYRLILTDGEQVGIPLSFLLNVPRNRSVRHIMISHRLSIPKKMFFFDRFQIQRAVDRFVVYSTWQKRFIEKRWGVAGERVFWTPFQVDGDFFSPAKVSGKSEARIGAAGLEYRDYPILLAALEPLQVPTTIAAASPWSKRHSSLASQLIPPWVTVCRLNLYELRELYARVRFVVLPLYEVSFQAGVTTLLEAMSMGKAVILSRTQGQTDVVVDGETGLYVPPGDVIALRRAISYLWEHPQEAVRMGAQGRKLVEAQMDLVHYSTRFKGLVEQCLNEPGAAD
jgi:glycosyltransferase involved in cell wall biosynthesis